MKATDLSDDSDFRERMTLHLNGGDEWSEMHYEIVVRDGDKILKTGIGKVVRTDGSPHYKITDVGYAFGVTPCDGFDDALAMRKASEPKMLEECQRAKAITR